MMFRAFLAKIGLWIKRLMAIDTTNALYSSTDDVDMVIHATVLSYTVVPGAAGSRQAFTYDTGLVQYARPLGIYTFDGGTTYNDLGDVIPNGGSFGIGSALLPTFYVITQCSSTGVMTFTVVRSVGSGANTTVTINLLMLARDTPTAITLPGTISGSNAMNFFSKNKYRNIALRGTASPTFPVTVAHGLGTVPICAFWFNDGTYNSLNGTYNDNPIVVGENAVKMDATNLIVSGFTTGWQVIYRLYKEA